MARKQGETVSVFPSGLCQTSVLMFVCIYLNPEDYNENSNHALFQGPDYTESWRCKEYWHNA
jgi:hypothetical protein